MSATGQFLGWVDDGDDIGAAISTSYRMQGGSVSGEVTIFKSVFSAEVAPPKTKVLFKGIEAGKPFVIYR